MGPTAAGKTDLAVELVARMPAEIISVDSALVYKDMKIGTAMPDAKTLARAPHRLIDFLDPAEAYSAARFREDALREIEEVIAGGAYPAPGWRHHALFPGPVTGIVQTASRR